MKKMKPCRLSCSCIECSTVLSFAPHDFILEPSLYRKFTLPCLLADQGKDCTNQIKTEFHYRKAVVKTMKKIGPCYRYTRIKLKYFICMKQHANFPYISVSHTFQENFISTEDLREYFECPVCFLVPRKPPIYACIRGHMICASCKVSSISHSSRSISSIKFKS